MINKEKPIDEKEKEEKPPKKKPLDVSLNDQIITYVLLYYHSM